MSVFRLFTERICDLRMFTVWLIVMSTSFLAVTGIIDGTATVAVLSGIVGYVLGGIEKESKNK